MLFRSAHIQILREYGLPCVVSINNFPTDTDAEIALIRELAVGAGAETVVVNRGFALGGEGATELAEAVVEACERPNSFHQLTPDGTPLKGPADLRAAVLSRSDMFMTVATEKLMTYALGRPVHYNDMATVRAIVRDAARRDNRFSALVLGIVESAPFRQRIKKS